MWILALAIGIITALLAARKGYNFFAWVLAGGILGLIILATLPFANRPELPQDEQARLKKRGNVIGGVISGLAVVLILIRLAAGS